MASVSSSTVLWERNGFPQPGEDLDIIGNMISNGEPCSPDPLPAVERNGYHAAIEVPEDLKPSKAYSAIFNARFKKDSDPAFVTREVHRFVFQTSRYGDFAEQVHSYQIDEGSEGGPDGAIFSAQAEAIYEIDRTIDAGQVTAAQAVLAGNSVPEEVARYADPFVRLVNGALGLNDLAAAVTTEFNVIRDGPRVLGILVRSPEPFNDPKIPRKFELPVLPNDPDDLLQDTVALSVNGGATTDFEAVFARDASQVFLTLGDHSLDLPKGAYHLRFTYLQFDGDQYSPVAVVDDVDFDVS